jgi:hypothetical protein
MYIIPATACSTPLPVPPRTFLASDMTKANTRVAELSLKHPSWPSCRVRAAVARELNISTVQLRYLLRQAAK